MVSVAELLNPEPPRAPLPTCRPPPPLPSPAAPPRTQPALPPARSSIEPLRMTENTKSSAARRRAKGVINFPPFEVLDEPALREVHRFQVRPFGSIQQTCERIPYNSGKKDFFSKTGREGFEAFHYEFKVPGDDAIYRVMWDYNVGLVRMTSFFKCRGYSKTTPAKMLNLNPGLKDITYSITGGSIKAQGYWMPFECAKAICATFCHKISGALIPIFGPDFPFECIPEKAPGHGRMTISPEIVARAKSEAAALFRLPPALPSPRPSRSVSPLPSRRAARLPERDYHSDYDRRLLLSPYTDTDVDYHPPAADPYGRGGYAPMRIPTSRPPTGTGPGPAAPTPQHSPGWTAVNHPPHPGHPHPPPPHHRRAASHLHEELLTLSVSATANPWLSALPRGPAAAGPSRWPAAAASPPHPHPRYRSVQPPLPPSSPQSSTSPDWGTVTLPPLRMLKRPFDQVDRRSGGAMTSTPLSPRRNPNTAPNNNLPMPEDHDSAYDACSSRATSASPASRKAAPPTPIRRNAGTATTTNTARSSPAVVNPTSPLSHPTTTSPFATTPHAPPPRRRESERNAAITLLHLHRREGSASPPPQAQAQSQSQPRLLNTAYHFSHEHRLHGHHLQDRGHDARIGAIPEGSGQHEEPHAGGEAETVRVERAREGGRDLEGEGAAGWGGGSGWGKGGTSADAGGGGGSPGVIHVALSPEAGGGGDGDEEEGPRAGIGGRLKRRRVLGW